MLESIMPLLVAYFMLAEPIYVFNAYWKRSPHARVKTEAREENSMRQAYKHLEGFQEKEGNMDQAEEKEKHDIVEAESIIEKLKYFIESEKRFNKGIQDFLKSINDDSEQVEFPHKDQFLATLKEENTFIDEVLNDLKDSSAICRRLNNASITEVRQLKKDLHKSLIIEKEGRFEHALSKNEIEEFKNEAKYLSEEEGSLRHKSGVLKSEFKLLTQTIKLLKDLKHYNSVAISVLHIHSKSVTEDKKIDEDEIKLVQKKEGLIETIIINIHTMAHILKTPKQHIQNMGGVIGSIGGKMNMRKAA